MINAKICRRDGEPPAILEFSGIRVEMGLTELQSLLRCALMDIGNSAGPVRRILDEPVKLLLEATNQITSLSMPPTEEDNEVNLKRYHLTGMGGETDLRELLEVVVACRSLLGKCRTNEEFNRLRYAFHQAKTQQAGDDFDLRLDAAKEIRSLT